MNGSNCMLLFFTRGAFVTCLNKIAACAHVVTIRLDDVTSRTRLHMVFSVVISGRGAKHLIYQ